MTEQALREQMCEVGSRLWERGLIGASEGNLSARLAPDRLLCTPSGLSKGHLSADELVVIDLAGNSISGAKPSSEIKLHLKAYELRLECGAVVHAHPPTATGFSLAGETIPDNLLPEAAVILGPVALAPFAMPGTDEVPNGLAPLLPNHKTFLLGNHGAATLGNDLWDAYDRMETLERVAKIILTARMLGTCLPLPLEAQEAFRERFLHGKLD